MDDLNKFKIGNVPTCYYIPNFLSDSEQQILMSQINAQKTWKTVSHRRLQNWGGYPHPKGMVPAKLPNWLDPICTKLGKDLSLYGGKIPNHVLINEYEPGGGIMPHTDGPLYFPTAAIVSLENPIMMNIFQNIGLENNSEMTMETLSSNNNNNNNKNENENMKQEEEKTEEQELKQKAQRKLLFTIVLEPKSLLIFKDDVYSKLLHGIEFQETDLIDEKCANLNLIDSNQFKLGDVMKRKKRVSLTVRLVEKLLKGIKF